MLKYDNRYNMCTVGQENCGMLEKKATHCYMCSALRFQEMKQLAHQLFFKHVFFFFRELQFWF